MSRRKNSVKRNIIKDPFYRSEFLSKFINKLMKNGKKGVAQDIVYKSLRKSKNMLIDSINVDKIKKKEKNIELYIFKKAIENIRPSVEVKSRRVGGATYQVPIELKYERSIALSFKWLIDSSRKRNEKWMIEKLSREICDSFNKKGLTFKKKENTHKIAKANQAFIYFRWN